MVHIASRRDFRRFAGTLGALWVFAVLLTISGASQAWAQAGGVDPSKFTITKECFPNGTDQPPDPRCTHSRMLKEGNDLQAVYMIQAAKKVELVEKKAEGDYPALVKEGTCLKADQDRKGCLKRLKMLQADAQVSGREETLKNNSARKELVDDEAHKVIGSNDVSGQRLSQDAGVLKDLQKANKVLKQGKGPTTLRELYQVRPVDFGNKTGGQAGDSLKNADKLDLREAKKEDLRDINKRAAMEIDEKNGSLTVEGEKTNQQLQKAVSGARRDLGSTISKNQKAMEEEGRTLKLKSNEKTVGDEAFEGAIDFVEGKLGDDPAKKKVPQEQEVQKNLDLEFDKVDSAIIQTLKDSTD